MRVLPLIIAASPPFTDHILLLRGPLSLGRVSQVWHAFLVPASQSFFGVLSSGFRGEGSARAPIAISLGMTYSCLIGVPKWIPAIPLCMLIPQHY